MKAINIIGLLLIALISTIGNRIAPGRYCAISLHDTVWAFGQTKYAENAKQGFWVYLDRWGKMQNLSCVINYSDNKRDGWVVEFHNDSLQRKCSEIFFKNDTVDGTAKYYNIKGDCNHFIKYKNGEMIRVHYLIYEDFGFVDYMAHGKEKPDALDSMIVDMSGGMAYIMPFMYETTFPEKEDRIVVFNSWTNNITTINVVICCILLVLNVVSIAKKRKK